MSCRQDVGLERMREMLPVACSLHSGMQKLSQRLDQAGRMCGTNTGSLIAASARLQAAQEQYAHTVTRNLPSWRMTQQMVRV